MAAVTFGRWCYTPEGMADDGALEWAAREVFATSIGRDWPPGQPVIWLHELAASGTADNGGGLDDLIAAELGHAPLSAAPVRLIVAAQGARRRLMISVATEVFDAWSADEILRRVLHKHAGIGSAPPARASTALAPPRGAGATVLHPGPPTQGLAAAPTGPLVTRTLRVSRRTLTRLRTIAAAARLDLGGLLATACAVVVARHRGRGEVRIELRLPGRASDQAAVLGSCERTVAGMLEVDERRGFWEVLRNLPAVLAQTEVAAPEAGVDVRVIAEPSTPVWLPPGVGVTREPLAEVLAPPDADVFTLLVASIGPAAAAIRTQLGRQRVAVSSLRHLERLLARVAAEPDRPLRDLEMLSARERQRIIVSWNATHRTYPRAELMYSPFERQACARPDAVAVVHGEQVVTYGALDARANEWARRLVAVGAGPERFVGVRLARTPEMVAVMLGALKAGAAYVPLDPSYPPDRLAFMAEDSRLAVLITDDEVELGDRAVPVVRPTYGPTVAAPAEPRPIPRTCPDGAAYVLYTSGSTGRPKGAVLTHANAADLLYWADEVFGPDLQRVLATTSICFDCSILEIFAPLSWGGTVVLADNALDIGVRAVGHDVRLLHTVPSVMAALLRLGQLPASLATVLLGGETPWTRLIDDVYRNSGVRRLLNLYGPTECTSYATMSLIRPRHDGAVPIGHPIANTWIRLLDQHGNVVPVGAPGEIYIGGRGVARGYLRRPSLTAERFVPDPFAPTSGERLYRTGDLARYGYDGALTFLGRVDDQVKVRGVRIEPAEVERALLEHPDVAEAAVTAPDDGPSRQRLVAYVVGRHTAAPTAAELAEFLGARLPAALVPDAYVTLDAMPRLPNGKVDRRSLPAEASCTRAPHVAPRNDLEAAVVRQWADALGLPDLGVYDDVYALGGQSLAALRVRARLRDELAVDIPVELVFTRHTAASLAEGIRALDTGRADEDLPVLPPPGRHDGPAPLSPNQAAVLARVRRDPDDWTLHLPLCVRVRGTFRPGALRLALTELIRRQDVLRSRIDYGRGRPQQAVAPAEPVLLPMVDLSALPAKDREAVAVELSVAAARAPFDVRKPPLVHALLFRLAVSDHVIAVTLHQVVADVWSMEAVGQQLLDLYQMAAGIRRPRLIDPPVRYHDWARWQRRWLASPRGRAQRRFWVNRLASVPALVLPPGRPRQPSAKISAGSHAFDLSGALLQRLTRLAGQESATLHIALLAAFAAALGAWSGRDDFVVGCPTSGRIHPELESVVGPFVDALVIRVDLSGTPGYRDLLRRVRDRSWEAYSHQRMTFAQLVRDLGAGDDPTRHPVYQTSIVVHYLAPDADVPTGLEVTDFGRRPPPVTALDIELAIYVGHDGAECAVTFRRDLFEDEEIERFAAGYVELLESASTTPDEPCPRAPSRGLVAVTP